MSVVFPRGSCFVFPHSIFLIFEWLAFRENNDRYHEQRDRQQIIDRSARHNSYGQERKRQQECQHAYRLRGISPQNPDPPGFAMWIVDSRARAVTCKLPPKPPSPFVAATDCSCGVLQHQRRAHHHPLLEPDFTSLVSERPTKISNPSDAKLLLAFRCRRRQALPKEMAFLNEGGHPRCNLDSKLAINFTGPLCHKSFLRLYP